jgi:hypothetical protein
VENVDPSAVTACMRIAAAYLRRLESAHAEQGPPA